MIGWGQKSFQVPGLGHQESGTGVQVRVRVPGLITEPDPVPVPAAETRHPRMIDPTACRRSSPSCFEIRLHFAGEFIAEAGDFRDLLDARLAELLDATEVREEGVLPLGS